MATTTNRLPRPLVPATAHPTRSLTNLKYWDMSGRWRKLVPGSSAVVTQLFALAAASLEVRRGPYYGRRRASEPSGRSLLAHKQKPTDSWSTSAQARRRLGYFCFYPTSMLSVTDFAPNMSTWLSNATHSRLCWLASNAFGTARGKGRRIMI